MKNYKDQNGKVHNIDPAFEHLLPAGCTPITDTEAAALLQPPQAPDYRALRAEAYRAESDPLFFKAARGEISNEVWLTKVAEIKSRFEAQEA